jgi:hypothetical protein
MRMPSPALVLASFALFVALGGTGYAVTALPRDSVTSTQVKDGSLEATDLSASLRGDISARAKAPGGPKGARGPKGDKGAKGSAGAPGPQGQTGTQGPTGSRGEKGDTGETGTAGLSSPKFVYDGNGNRIGDLITVKSIWSSGASILARINGYFWDIDSWSGYVSPAGSYAVFRSNDCSGAPVLRVASTPRPAGALTTGLAGLVMADGSQKAYRSLDWRISTAPAGTYFSEYQVMVSGQPGVCNPAYGANPTTQTSWYVDDLVEVSVPVFTPPLTIG